MTSRRYPQTNSAQALKVRVRVRLRPRHRSRLRLSLRLRVGVRVSVRASWPRPGVAHPTLPCGVGTPCEEPPVASHSERVGMLPLELWVGF